MPDMEKVVNGIEHCLMPGFDGCAGCLYFDETKESCGGTNEIMKDALELIKAQESVKPLELWNCGYYFVCGACRHNFGIVDGDPKYCPECGRKVKWDA